MSNFAEESLCLRSSDTLSAEGQTQKTQDSLENSTTTEAELYAEPVVASSSMESQDSDDEYEDALDCPPKMEGQPMELSPYESGEEEEDEENNHFDINKLRMSPVIQRHAVNIKKTVESHEDEVIVKHEEFDTSRLKSSPTVSRRLSILDKLEDSDEEDEDISNTIFDVSKLKSSPEIPKLPSVGTDDEEEVINEIKNLSLTKLKGTNEIVRRSPTFAPVVPEEEGSVTDNTGWITPSQERNKASSSSVFYFQNPYLSSPRTPKFISIKKEWELQETPSKKGILKEVNYVGEINKPLAGILKKTPNRSMGVTIVEKLQLTPRSARSSGKESTNDIKNTIKKESLLKPTSQYGILKTPQGTSRTKARKVSWE